MQLLYSRTLLVDECTAEHKQKYFTPKHVVSSSEVKNNHSLGSTKKIWIIQIFVSTRW